MVFDHDDIDRPRTAYCIGRPAPQSLKLMTIINGEIILPPFANTIWTVFFESDDFASLVIADGIPEGR